MTTFTTISGRKIKVSSNRQKRTFTIVTDAAKYRTIRLSADEFETLSNNTANDWQRYLNHSDDYYKID